jgi:hypothetical protein
LDRFSNALKSRDICRPNQNRTGSVKERRKGFGDLIWPLVQSPKFGRFPREARRFNRVNLLKQQDCRCAVCKAAFDADDNTTVLVRRDSVTGDTARFSPTAGAV